MLHKDATIEPAADLIAVGQALSHPARLRILQILVQDERCGCELAPLLGLDPSVVSRHLALLSRAGLITARRDGPRLIWRLASQEIPRLLDRLSSLPRERQPE